jgi:hypothetical protein
MSSCPQCQGKLYTREAIPTRQVCGSCGRVQPREFRQVLLDDLAILKLHLEDDLINDGQAGEALARVVGALDLTAEEETWLEEQ